MKFQISIITRDGQPQYAFLDNKQAKETLNKLNTRLDLELDDVWLYYELQQIEANGFLLTTDRNYISLIIKNGEITYCYLNNIKKAENDYARLVKEGREDITYEIVRFIELIKDGE
jgi:dsDNA-binding SOS-regulon protein